ncbi:MAG TPA: hypothetical protein VFE25_04620 [Opitutaceae bacterium]|jgi:hypothetical protein|nr:hypothetical protein [Opitutaceae bacterium]
MPFRYIIICAMVLSVLLVRINQRLASPVLAIADRWLRWLIFPIVGAWACRYLEIIDRPVWVIAVAGFLTWFLVETLYNWLEIAALSVSPFPLFPRYSVNSSGEEWPIQPKFLKIREWLRAQGFRQVQALKAEISGDIYLRVSVYQDEAALLRVQVTFLPQNNGAIDVCYALTSMAVDGSRYVTDNLYIPFGGFYPENWFVDRRPCCRSLPRLLALHRSRIASMGRALVPLTVDPMADLNDSQSELDRVNTELGFLNPRGAREDHGKISNEGRYRVWKEIWMLNYLGRAARYD